MGFWRLGVATTLLAAMFAFASASPAGAVPSAQIAKVGAAPANTSLHLVLPLSADLAGLRRIQEMTAELGMNLAGVERVFELEDELDSMSRKVAALERRARELKNEVERLEALRRELRAEIVPYERGGEIVRHKDLQRFTIAVERRQGRRPDGLTDGQSDG